MARSKKKESSLPKTNLDLPLPELEVSNNNDYTCTECGGVFQRFHYVHNNEHGKWTYFWCNEMCPECLSKKFPQVATNEDNVNHPKHYNSHPSGVEALDICRHMNFNLGNVIKYLFRCGLKDKTTELEDLKKARFYLDDEIKRLEHDD